MLFNEQFTVSNLIISLEAFYTACRGNLRKCIVSLNSYYLQSALKAAKINIFLDTHERQDPGAYIKKIN